MGLQSYSLFAPLIAMIAAEHSEESSFLALAFPSHSFTYMLTHSTRKHR